MLVVQVQLAAAHQQQGQNAAQAQEVIRLQRQLADLRAETANQAVIIRQCQQNKVELTQQLQAAQAGMESPMHQTIISSTNAE